MRKKILIQFFLFLVILFTCVILYLLFLKKDEIKNISAGTTDKTADKVSKSDKNIITKMSYYAEDYDGNKYEILSDYGEFNPKDINLILMTNVTGIITFKDQEPIKILSKKAKYNDTNHNTNFFDGVVMSFETHKINSDKLDLSFGEKFATISDNVMYKNLNTKLRADKIEFDMITKNSKIYMNNKTDKIKIINLY